MVDIMIRDMRCAVKVLKIAAYGAGNFRYAVLKDPKIASFF